MTLTIRDAVDLAAVIEAAISGRKVKWLTETEQIVEGVARSIGTETGGNLADGDVREGFLHVSAGFEWFLPMSKVLEMYRGGTFIVMGG